MPDFDGVVFRLESEIKRLHRLLVWSDYLLSRSEISVAQPEVDHFCAVLKETLGPKPWPKSLGLDDDDDEVAVVI